MAFCATGMRPVSTNLSGIGSSRPLSLPSSRNFFDSFPLTRVCLKSASRFASLQQQQLTCWKLRDVTAVDASAVSGSYRAAQGNETSSTAANDLLVVGAGVLGSLIGTNWLQQKQHERCKVVGQTNTCNRHEELRTLGIVPVTRNQQDGDDKFPFVVFSAPPSGSEDYVAEIRAAAQRWNGEGSLLLTSSSAVYDVSDNSVCDEISPLVAKGRSPRTDLLLNAEEEVLKVGGNVVRLAGLYTLERGAHTFWLSKGAVDARPDHILNLIHYEDAAALCVAILRKQTRSQVFMGCDNTPVSRQDIMDAVAHSGKFEGRVFQSFTRTDGPLGKKMNNDVTRSLVDWQPKYKSFAAFLGI